MEPASAVVSIVTPDGCTSIRAAFCDQIHFFTSAEVARQWLAQHPGATVLPIAEAFALGGPLTQNLLADDGPSCC